MWTGSSWVEAVAFLAGAIWSLVVPRLSRDPQDVGAPRAPGQGAGAEASGGDSDDSSRESERGPGSVPPESDLPQDARRPPAPARPIAAWQWYLAHKASVITAVVLVVMAITIGVAVAVLDPESDRSDPEPPALDGRAPGSSDSDQKAADAGSHSSGVWEINAADEIERGRGLARAGLLDDAGRAFSSAAEVGGPDAVGGYLGTAELAFEEGEFDDALRAVDSGLREFPNAADLLRLRSLIHEARSDLELALRDAQAYLDVAQSVEAEVRMATVLNAQGRFADALIAADAATRRDPSFAGATFERAVALLGLGRQSEGEEILRSLIATSPSPDPRWHMSMGRLLAARGDLEGATAELRRSIQLDPTSPLYRLELGDIERMRGRPASAEEAYQTAAVQGVDPLLVELRMGWVELPADPGAARRTATRLLSEGTPEALRDDLERLLVESDLALQQWPEAVSDAEDSLARDPDSPDMRLNLARAHAGLGDWEVARLHATQAAESSPEWSRPWENIAHHERQLGDLPASLAAGQQALALARTTADQVGALHQIGVTQYYMGEPHGSVASLEAAVAVDPDAAWLRSELAWFGYDEVGDHRAALETLSQAVETARASGNMRTEITARFRIAWIQSVRLNDDDVAMSVLDGVIEDADPDEDQGSLASVHSLRAGILQERGDLVAAAESYELIGELGDQVTGARGLALMFATNDCSDNAVEELDRLSTSAPEDSDTIAQVARALDDSDPKRADLLERALTVVIRRLGDEADPEQHTALSAARVTLMGELGRSEEVFDLLSTVPDADRTPDQRTALANAARESDQPMSVQLELAAGAGLPELVRSIAFDMEATDPMRQVALDRALEVAERRIVGPVESLPTTVIVDYARTLGDHERLQEAFDLLAALPPEQHDASSLRELAYAALRTSRPPVEIEGYARRALELNPTDAYSRAVLAGALVDRGDLDSARIEIASALASDADESYANDIAEWIAQLTGVAVEPAETPPTGESASDDGTAAHRFRERFCVSPVDDPDAQGSDPNLVGSATRNAVALVIALVLGALLAAGGRRFVGSIRSRSSRGRP